MKRKNEFLALIVIICIVVVAIFIINVPLSREVIPSRFIIGDRMGFDLSPGNLNFGKIVPGYGASRNITVRNDYDKLIKIDIISTGNISNNLIVSENNFILKPLEARNITFTIYTDRSIKFGEYDGKIIIVSKIAW